LIQEPIIHQPVLLEETVAQLQIKPAGIYIDATFGRGGHSAALLKQLGPHGRLFAIDQDPEAADWAKKNFPTEKRLVFLKGAFTHLAQWAREYAILGHVNGIILDIGVSSPQLADPSRGFSFLHDGPLDMRMDPTQGQTAAEWLATASIEEMANLFKNYGEERFAHRIAKALATERQRRKITHTTQLAALICQAHPSWPKRLHPATKVFQAIRIHINQELAALSDTLEQALAVLGQGGRLTVITFHSLEAQVVKRFVNQTLQFSKITAPPIKWVKKKIKPSNQETIHNPRARSAILRVIEKL
jgi:16S rRNA (cytosine1402-N4)-methyltransferase